MNRLLGILGLWIALGLLTDPIIKILDVVAVVGATADTIMRPINAVGAITVGSATILISMVFHNIYLLVGVLALILIVAVRYLRSRYGNTASDKKIPTVTKEMVEADTQTDTASST